MAIITYPLNNIEYSAEDAELFHCTRTSGVFSADNEFVASVTGTDNNVTIGTGIAWIRNSKFAGKVVANKTAVVLDMGIADGAYSRIDAIVIQFDANANKTSIIVKNGTAASNPIPPQVVRTEALYELHIYHVRRPAGATAVYAENVTDLRQDKTYCGIMFDDVTIVDGDAFMTKETYDPDGAVATAGGIPDYVATNAPKIPLSSSVTSSSTTTAANSAAVKTAYDRANEVSRSIPQLSSSVNSTSTTTAANSYAVQQAYSKAVSAQNTANGKASSYSYTELTSAKLGQDTNGVISSARLRFAQCGKIATMQGSVYFGSLQTELCHVIFPLTNAWDAPVPFQGYSAELPLSASYMLTNIPGTFKVESSPFEVHIYIGDGTKAMRQSGFNFTATFITSD